VSCIRVYKRLSSKDASIDISEFCGNVVSHDKHTLFALEESGPPRMTYTYESQ
jgi:hypothetical protein